MLTLLTWPNPWLLKSCKPWDFSNPSVSDYDEFEKSMIDTMINSHGIGLAANQVGYDFRVLVIHVQENDTIIVMYNPKIKQSSLEQWNLSESCLSFPKVVLEVPRSKHVTVEWYDKEENYHEQTFNDIDARCLLHEIDHLNGIVFKKYVSDLKFNIATKKASKL